MVPPLAIPREAPAVKCAERRRGSGMLLLAALLFSPPAHAQRPDTVAPVSLDTLVVTVLRAPLPLVRAPYALAVVTGSEIRRAQPGLSLQEALVAVPGVQVDNRYNYALGDRISIRGFGARSQFGVRGVRVLLDGIPLTLPDGQTALSNVDPAVLGRVEVVRGPASLLYGNAAGGVIQLQTRPPPEVTFAQEVRVAAGADGLLRTSATGGGRSGGSGYLFHLARLGYGGYREYSEARNLYATARWEYTGERNRLAVTLNGVDYDAENPGSLSDSLLSVDRSRAFSRNVVQRTGESGRQGQLGATLARAFPGAELELSAYGLARGIDNPIPNVIIALDRQAGGVRATLRSPLHRSATLRWAFGTELDGQRDDRRNFANLRGERGERVLDQLERVRNLALFAEAGTSLAPRLELSGGVRYDRVRFSARDRLVEGNPDDSGERTLDALSPAVGATYSPGSETTLYANVATAFETPTTTELANRPNGAGGFNPDLSPQRAVSYEVGSRGVLAGLASYQLAIYRADVRDELIPFEVSGAPGRQFFRNAGSSRRKGVEAAVAVEQSGWTGRAAYTFTDARFRDYVVDGVRLDGNRIPGVAPHRLEALLSYQSSSGMYVTAEARLRSDTPVDDANSADSPGYAVADLRAGVRQLRLGGTTLSPFLGVSNLFDRPYDTSVVVNAFGDRFYEPGPGRALYAGIGVSWNVAAAAEPRSRGS